MLNSAMPGKRQTAVRRKLDRLKITPDCYPACDTALIDPITSDHNRIDDRSLAMHRLVAEKLRADPALLDTARENLRRWQDDEASPSLTLAEWETILSGPAVQVARFLEERSERATRLRQSSPFAGILTEAERGTIHKRYLTETYYSGRHSSSSSAVKRSMRRR